MTEPVPSPIRITDIYSRCAPEYEKRWGAQLSVRGRMLIEGMAIARARRVLDLGAGVGVNLQPLREVAPGAIVVAADGAEGMLRLAGGPRVVLDAHQLSFAGGSFDAVLMAFVLHHLADPAAAVREVSRVLAPGGWLAAGTWADDPEALPANDIWIGELDAHGAPKGPDITVGQAATSTPEKMSAMLDAAGLDVERIETNPLDDRMDVEEFLGRRTKLGLSGWRFESLEPDARAACLAKARARLDALAPEDLNARETAILTWARKRA